MSPPFAFEVDDSTEALVPPSLLKVALYRAAYEVRAHLLDVSRSEGRTVFVFDRDVPQGLIVEELRAKREGASV